MQRRGVVGRSFSIALLFVLGAVFFVSFIQEKNQEPMTGKIITQQEPNNPDIKPLPPIRGNKGIKTVPPYTPPPPLKEFVIHNILSSGGMGTADVETLDNDKTYGKWKLANSAIGFHHWSVLDNKQQPHALYAGMSGGPDSVYHATIIGGKWVSDLIFAKSSQKPYDSVFGGGIAYAQKFGGVVMVFAHYEADTAGNPQKTTVYVAVPASGNANNCGQWLCAPLTTIFPPEYLDGVGLKTVASAATLPNGNLYIVLNKIDKSNNIVTTEGYEVAVGTPIKVITQETIIQASAKNYVYKDSIIDPTTNYPVLVFVRPDTQTYQHQFVFAQRKSGGVSCPGSTSSWSCASAGKHQFPPSPYPGPYNVELAIESNSNPATIYFLEYDVGYGNTLYKIVNMQVQSTGVKVDNPAFIPSGIFSLLDVENSIPHSGMGYHTHIILSDYDHTGYPNYNMLKSRMIHCIYPSSSGNSYSCNPVDPVIVAVSPPQMLLDLAVIT